jgi:hypothetical protein
MALKLSWLPSRHVARRDPAKHATTLVAPVGIIRAVGKWPSIASIVEATGKLRMEHDGCGRAARGPDLLLIAHAALPSTARATPATKPRLPTYLQTRNGWNQCGGQTRDPDEILYDGWRHRTTRQMSACGRECGWRGTGSVNGSFDHANVTGSLADDIPACRRAPTAGTARSVDAAAVAGK